MLILSFRVRSHFGRVQGFSCLFKDGENSQVRHAGIADDKSRRGSATRSDEGPFKAIYQIHKHEE
jgi:hypothetical protein